MKRELEPEVMDGGAEVALYDAMDHQAPNAAFVDRLLQLGVQGDCLDVGTGNGLIPLLLCGRTEDVACTGVDLSEAMLELAQRHLAASRFTERVRFERGDATRLHFDDGAFDAVFSNTILHHLAEPEPLLAEAWRVLRPGGVLLIRDLLRPEDEQAVEGLVTKHAMDEPAEAQQLLRQSLKAAFTVEELETMTLSLGWVNVDVVVDSDRHVSIQTKAKAV